MPYTAAPIVWARIAREVGMHEENVAIWRRRFMAQGVDGLADAPRAGGPLTYGHDERLKIAALAWAVEARPCAERPASQPPSW
jgi:hypothetical protein